MEISTQFPSTFFPKLPNNYDNVSDESVRRRRTSSVILPAIEFDPGAGMTLQRQIYSGYREAILSGRLTPGLALPSTRLLAQELGVSRNTVMFAFEQLSAEGYVQCRQGGGTYVSISLPEHMTSAPRASRATVQRESLSGRRVSKAAQSFLTARSSFVARGWGAFRISLPALDQFPVELWSRLVSKHSRRIPRQLLGYCDPLGYRPLREAIANYLRLARAANCCADQVMIVSGSQQALHLISRVLLNPGDRVAVEEPGYPGACGAFLAASASIAPVSVDEEGLRVRPDLSRHRGTRAVYVTPSHQYPLGMTMSLRRRIELLEWARRECAWIIEDDYDSEYRYVTRPIACLQGMDGSARVIYVGTFSKVLFPSLRIGYMILPSDLLSAFSAAKEHADLFSPTLYQAVLTDFIKQGHFGRHLRRMRCLYQERVGFLKSALERELGNEVAIAHADSGMYLTALLTSQVDDVALATKAAEQNIVFTPLSTCYRTSARRSGLILGVGGADRRQIEAGVSRLGGIVRDLSKRIVPGFKLA